MRLFFHYVASFLTRSPRQRVEIGVDFEWSTRSWVHNIFRLYELTFGRRYGIRHEMSAGPGWQQPHTFEALCAIVEFTVRNFFKREFAFKLVTAPALIANNGVLFPSAYRFAIAFDAIANNTSPNKTWTHTQTGSNRLLFMGASIDVASGGAVTAIDYGGTAGALTHAEVNNGDRHASLCHVVGGPSGANTVTITSTAATSIFAASDSYTGCSQTGVPDATNTASGTGASLAVAVVTVADNCWVMGAFFDTNGAGATSAGASTTDRGGVATWVQLMDNNAAKTPAGSVTLNGNDGNAGAHLVWQAASFKPTGNATVIYFPW